MYVRDALAGRESSAIMHNKRSLRALKVRMGAPGIIGGGRGVSFFGGVVLRCCLALAIERPLLLLMRDNSTRLGLSNIYILLRGKGGFEVAVFVVSLHRCDFEREKCCRHKSWHVPLAP